MKKTCIQCNKEFEKPHSLSKENWKSRTYCTRACRNTAYPPKVKLTCKQCSSEYLVRNSLLGRSKYCSKNCMNNAYPPKKTLVCLECEKHFTVRNYLKNRTYFCSHSCASQYRDEGKRCEDKKIRQSWAYKLWRKAVFERDDFTCVECGVRGGVLNADHIKPFALYPELRLEVSNGRTLCVNCHLKTDTWGRGQMFRKVCYATGSTV